MLFAGPFLDRGKTFLTVEVYSAAISACHIGFDSNSREASPVNSFYEGGASLRFRLQAISHHLGTCLLCLRLFESSLLSRWKMWRNVSPSKLLY